MYTIQDSSHPRSGQAAIGNYPAPDHSSYTATLNVYVNLMNEIYQEAALRFENTALSGTPIRQGRPLRNKARVPKRFDYQLEYLKALNVDPNIYSHDNRSLGCGMYVTSNQREVHIV